MGRHFLSAPKDEIALRQTIQAEGPITPLEALKPTQEKWGLDRAFRAPRPHPQPRPPPFPQAR